MTGYRLSSQVVFRPEGRAGVVFFPDTGRLEPLNEVGAYVLRGVESAARLDDIVEAVCRAYDADREIVRRDVVAFLEQMEEEGIVVRDGV